MDDTISRQVAIDALCELYEYQRDIDPTEAADLVRQGIYLAEKKIERLPSAQQEITLESAIDYLHSIGWMQEHDRILTESARQEQQWIPVSERLPEKDGRYLVTCTKWGAWEVDWNIFYKEPREGWLWEQDVSAWMPLPEPYDGEES